MGAQGLLDKNFLGLYGGVSQQPASLRDNSQLELQENCWSSLVDGLQTRPATELIASLHADIDEDSMFHYIDRDSGEKYIVIFTGDATTPIRVYDMGGVEKTVNYGVITDDKYSYDEDLTVKDYLDCNSPKSDLRAYTIADVTFVTNKSTNVLANAASPIVTPPQGLISVESVVNNQDYSIFVNETKEGETNSGPSSTSESIANSLYLSLISNLGSLANRVIINIDVSPDIETRGLRFSGSPPDHITITINGVEYASSADITEATHVTYDGTGSLSGSESPAVLNRPETARLVANALRAGLDMEVWVVETVGASVHVQRQDGATFTYSYAVLHGAEITMTAPDVTGDGWIITRDEDSSVVYIQRADNTDFDLHGHDSWGNKAMKIIKAATQRFTDLPNTAPDGFLVKVGKNEGGGGVFSDGYYLRFEHGDHDHAGIWRETRKEGIMHGFDADTMPHHLIRLADGTFVFAPINWAERQVGDNLSLPYPSFINQPVNNIFLHANRLCFLSGENMIATRTDNFFNFWPSTVLDVLDTDPIDIALSDETISPLQDARAFDRSLLLFSKDRQYVVSSGDLPFSPNAVTAQLATSYKVTDDVKPISVGSSVFFATPSGNYSRIHEYFVQPDSIVSDAEDTTAHVPSYIPANVNRLTGSTSFDMVLAQTVDEPKNVYAYIYRWQGNNKVQSSWSKWTFDDDVLFMEIQGSFVYMVTRRGSEVYMEKMSLELTNTASLTYNVRLDKQKELTGAYDSQTEQTTWTLPYTDDPATDIRAIVKSTGHRVTLSERTATTVVAEGDHSGEVHILGRHYTPKFTMSEWFIKPEGANATIAGKIKMRSLKLAFTDSGAFKVKVTPRGRDTLIHTHTGVKLGVTLFGNPEVSTDEDTFALMCGSVGADVTIEGHTHLPFKFHAAQLRGMYVTHGKAI